MTRLLGAGRREAVEPEAVEPEAVEPAARSGEAATRTAVAHRPRLVAFVVALVIAVAAPVGVVFALFGDSAARAGGVVVTGDLDLAETPGGPVRWVETTAALPPDDRRAGSDFASLAAFRGVPGDTVEVRYQVTTTLAGDNISAVVRATLGAVTLPAAVSVSGYRVLDAAGAVLAPASGFTAIGSETTVPDLTGAGVRTLQVAVQLAWTGTAASLTYTSDFSGTGSAVLTTIPVTISLEQVRSGAGFAP